MTAKVTFSPSGTIHSIAFQNILGKTVGTVGEYPLVTTEKVEVITVDIIDLGNLVDLLNNL